MLGFGAPLVSWTQPLSPMVSFFAGRRNLQLEEVNLTPSKLLKASEVLGVR